MRYTLAGLLAVLALPVSAAELPLPPGAVARYGSQHFRSTSSAHVAVLSPDGKALALADGARVRLFDPTDWTLLAEYPTSEVAAFYAPGRNVAFSPDGKFLAYTRGRLVFVWDRTTGKRLRVIEGENPWRWTCPAAFTTDGLMALGDKDGLAFLDPATGREVRSVAAAWVMHVSPDGKHFVRRTKQHEPGPLVLGDAKTGKDLHTFDLVVGWINGAAFTPDGKRLTLVKQNGSEVEVWDVAARSVLKRLAAPPAERPEGRYGYGAGFTADGREVWLEMPNADVLRWDAATFAELPRVVCGNGPRPGEVIPSRDGKTLLTLCGDGWVRVWDAATGRERTVPGRYHDAVFAPAPDGKTVAVGDATGRVDLLDAATGKLVRALREKGEPVRRLVFAPDSALLAVSEARRDDQNWRAGRVRLLRVSDGDEFWARGWERDKDEWSLSPLGFADGGDYLVLAHYPKDVRVWDTGSGKELRRFAGVSFHALPSPDGKLFACDDHGEIVFTDLATGREVKRVEVDPVEKAGNALFAWSGDGRALATTLPGESVCVLDPASGKERVRFPVYSGEIPELLKGIIERNRHLIRALALSLDGKQLAASALNGSYVAVWDAATGKEVVRLEHDFMVDSVTFTPDGKGVVTFGNTGLGYRWDIAKAAVARKK